MKKQDSKERLALRAAGRRPGGDATGRRVRPGFGIATDARRAFVQAMADGAGFQAACLAAGLARSTVLAALAQDPGFERAWQEAEAARRTLLEALLVDHAIAGLAAGGAPAPPPDKAIVALGQWLVAEARPGRSARMATGPAADTGKGAASPAAAGQPGAASGDIESDRVEALLELAARRIAAAEALDAAQSAGDVAGAGQADGGLSSP